MVQRPLMQTPVLQSVAMVHFAPAVHFTTQLPPQSWLASLGVQQVESSQSPPQQAAKLWQVAPSFWQGAVQVPLMQSRPLPQSLGKLHAAPAGQLTEQSPPQPTSPSLGLQQNPTEGSQNPLPQSLGELHPAPSG